MSGSASCLSFSLCAVRKNISALVLVNWDWWHFQGSHGKIGWDRLEWLQLHHPEPMLLGQNYPIPPIHYCHPPVCHYLPVDLPASVCSGGGSSTTTTAEGYQ